MKRSTLEVLLAMLWICTGCASNVFNVFPASGICGLHAPWDSLEDETLFHCFTSGEDFFFLSQVKDSTLTYLPEFKGESDVEVEDRVEIFFSPEQTMENYYCAEIDPLGRVLDYQGRFYRHLDYGWNFKTLKIRGWLTPQGYTVAGKVSVAELEGLGVDVEGGFYMGVFRADYRQDLSVNWYSAVSSDDPSPDFHKPDMLFATKFSKIK